MWQMPEIGWKCDKWRIQLAVRLASSALTATPVPAESLFWISPSQGLLLFSNQGMNPRLSAPLMVPPQMMANAPADCYSVTRLETCAKNLTKSFKRSYLLHSLTSNSCACEKPFLKSWQDFEPSSSEKEVKAFTATPRTQKLSLHNQCHLYDFGNVKILECKSISKHIRTHYMSLLLCPRIKWRRS